MDFWTWVWVISIGIGILALLAYAAPDWIQQWQAKQLAKEYRRKEKEAAENDCQ